MKFAVAALLIVTARAASADPLNCTLRDYTAQPGLSATAIRGGAHPRVGG